MKKSGFIFLFLLLIICGHAQEKICDYNITPSNPNFDGTGIPAGSTICITQGNYNYLYLSNIKGTSSNPITIVNEGVVVIDTDHYFGIKVSNCQYVKIIGENIASNYGIRITRVASGAGLSIDDLSSDIEIAGLEIANTYIGGIYAKSDPTCTNFSATRDKFTMYNLSIHDCYLHDIGDEGMYIGSSKYTGQVLSDCDTTVFPHVIMGVRVYNNIIENTGWDGIQVSSAITNCNIHNNIIRYDSQKETVYQMSGILIGGGSKCDCYNNQIYDGKGDGIDILGKGNMKIYNNLIVRAGKNFLPNDINNHKHGIYVGASPDNSNANYFILHNTIVNPKSTGINYFNSLTTENLISNNLIVEPGLLSSAGNQSYVSYDVNASHIVVKNNYLSSGTQYVGFVNTQDNFDLLANSPAVNSGTDLYSNAITFDILNRPRPHNNGCDIGAFECQDDDAGILSFDGAKKINLSPMPADNILTIEFDFQSNTNYKFFIINSFGQVVKEFTQNFNNIETKTTISIDNLKEGNYILRIIDEKQSYSEKIIVIK